MNYKEAVAYIEEVQAYGSVLGLENIAELCARLGNPQKDLKFIHIAGTNGKGSVLAFVSTVLQKAGYKVGRYISPTIFDYRERIQINGNMISKQALSACLGRIKEACDAMVEEGLSHPTLFEMETAMGFLYFKEKGCDLVVLETGLGGITDATNVIKNTIVAVLTSISRDHMGFLGSSLEEIAEKKAGIIKRGCLAVTSRQEPSVMNVLKQACQSRGAVLSIADVSLAKSVKHSIKKQSFSYKEYKKIEISMAGTYQIENGVTAIEVIRALKQAGYAIEDQAVYQGMAEAAWIGRFSVISRKPFFIVDGAHNEDGAKKLADSLSFYFTNKKIIYIMGVLRDKEYGKIIENTCFLADSILTIKPPHNERALEAYELAKEAAKYHNNVTALDSLEEAVELSLLMAEKDKDTVIAAFGSLSFLGELITILEHKKELQRDLHGMLQETGQKVHDSFHNQIKK
ncbi:MAG: bifunctional folylpolyglutamate synthase/dihydrofolate synthase [Lachnospiraceae bacterium]|nr:bifunctional folylpolyglutamate synthase/dihydrofolate synthase [Lachnospiraceae bacterium]